MLLCRLGRNVVATTWLLVVILAGSGWGAAPECPNILLIVTDDQGYWDTGATGNPDIDTPNMDSLARDGVQFKRFYCAPVCAPTRAGILTGRYYLRTGLYNTRFGGDNMGKGEITVAQLLKKAGYATGIFGKWHVGHYWGYRPNERGFDEFVGHHHGHLERYQFPDQIYHNNQPVEARGYVTDLFTDGAIGFIRTPRDAPFFCMLTYNAPHSPWLLDTSHFNQPEGDKLLKKYLDRGLEMREARIYALVERIDQNLGRLFTFLKDAGLEESTAVFFMSDNGGVSRHFKAGLNGFKASTYEGGVRSPLFVRWPGKFPAGGVVEGQASHIDLLPTFCELAGADVPADRTMDGKSLVPLLLAGRGVTHHQYVYHTWDRYFPNPDRRWSVSDQRWKLVGMFGEKTQPDPAKWRLFDLAADPGETKNLLKKHPEKVSELRAEFVRWFDEVTRGVTYVPIAIPVGNPQDSLVEIQASWGQWEGPNVAYTFDGYDWDSIDGWKEPGEKVSWKLDVLAGGDYEVTAAYGCAPAGMGGRFRVHLENSSFGLQATVRSTGGAEVFERFSLGTLRLAEGENRLVVEAVEVTGDELMRLNRLWLRKVPSLP